MEIETRIPVRYAETDQMGVVHHSVYPVWFECGRSDYIKAFGIPYDELERLGLMLPLIRLSLEYRNPIRYGDTVIVKTSLAQSSGVRMTISYRVFVEGCDKLCARGFTEHVWTSSELKPVNLSKFRPDVYSRLIPMFNEATGDRDRK